MLEELVSSALGDFMQSIGHPLGACLIHREKHICAINIPRCGSSSLKRVLINENFEYVQGGFIKPEGWKCFTILRNPYNRFISGLAEEYKHQDEINIQNFCEKYSSFIKEEKAIPRVPFLTPQYLFLPPWLSVDVFFHLENLQKVEEWLLKQYVVVNFTEVRENATTSEHIEIISDHFSPLMPVINDLYHIDWIIYNAQVLHRV